MILERVNEPSDLRHLTPEELVQFAAEIREFLLQTVSKTGGHLSPNLGTVELTLALHRVFDSPHDLILWDCGHQTYVHKMVTGRREAMHTIRQPGGLSGFPCRRESEHDWMENTHASPILAYAHGWATAVEAHDRSRRVVAVIGDGAMTGGMSYEGINNIGYAGRRVLLVINDNGRSYAPTVSRLSCVVEELSLSPAYVKGSARVSAAMGDRTDVGEALRRAVTTAPSGERPTPKSFFGALGWHYVGPVDGHEIGAIESALTAAADFDGPAAVHVLTVKGKGYRPAESDIEKRLHDVTPFDRDTGPVRKKPASPAAAATYTDVFSRSLVSLAHRDRRIHAITAAMPGPTGLLPFAAQFPDRFLDVGLAEQHAVATAAGMAMGGLRPVVAVFSTFLIRAFDQINLDVGLHSLPVVFCVDRAGITGSDGPSHHGVLDLALLSRVPGITILAPSSAGELPVMLEQALELDGPCVIRYPKGAAAPPDGGIGHGLTARRVGSGSEICLLAVGRMLAAAEQAAEELEAGGASTSVWDVRVATPLDPAMVIDAARHEVVITIEDGMREGGVGMSITDEIARTTGNAPRRPPVILGTPRRWLAHGHPDAILSELGLDASGIVRAAHESLVQRT
jgi:1-deoxy-D-xylulose-5-phosphate synthase